LLTSALPSDAINLLAQQPAVMLAAAEIAGTYAVLRTLHAVLVAAIKMQAYPRTLSHAERTHSSQLKLQAHVWQLAGYTLLSSCYNMSSLSL
jgi:hypothetical protein